MEKAGVLDASACLIKHSGDPPRLLSPDSTCVPVANARISRGILRRWSLTVPLTVLWE